ncbi:MAG: vitamin K epoxide reductase family protein, partial [Nitriliruptoraceae bacterium]
MTDTMTTPSPTRVGAGPTEGGDRTINGVLRAFIAVAVMGWFASAVLTAIHLWVFPLPDGVEPQGAIQVITSDWAKIGPIPLALIGAAYYTVMIAAGATLLHTKDQRIERLLLPVTSLGVLASAVFVYLQFGPIGAVCPFCMMSATATTLL